MSEHKAQGSVIKIGDNGSPVSYTTIGKVTDFSAPQLSRAAIDTTDLADESKTFISGIVDGGEVTFTVNTDYADSGQDAVRAAFVAGSLYDWKIEVTDEASTTTTIEFDGFVSAVGGPSGSVDEKLTTSFTVKVSGTITES